jgi:hypothetical protein
MNQDSENSNSQSMNLPPGELGLPILGQTLQFLFDRKFAEKQYAKYGAISKTSLLGIGVWKKLKQKMDERHIKRCPNIGHEKSKH